MSHRPMIAGFALLLAGCSVTTPHWVKPGAGPAEYAADKSYCDNRANAVSSVHFSAGFAGEGTFDDCMRSRGWVTPDTAAPPPKP